MGDKNLDFYAGLESLLRYHDEIGLGPVVINDDIRDFLSSRPPVPASVLGTTEITRSATAKPVVKEQTPVLQSTSEDLSYTLGDIEKEVACCSACDLHEKRVYPVAGRGTQPVRLMIVGDWLSLSGSGPANENLLFGLQQDQMLFRMLDAMKVPAEQVFITNVIKCAVSEQKPPQAKHVQACVSYLKRQILLLRPEFICTMGMVAARAVLERSVSLSRLRGKLHDYSLGGNEKTSVLTTYHPSYLLQNPEMKRATWDDLQFLAHKMGVL
ncbi:uracil-DNA glycosylase [Desulforhopalus sp. 52FAK]